MLQSCVCPLISRRCFQSISLLPNLLTISEVVTRFTQRVQLLEQELLTLPKHLSSPPVLSGVCVSRSLVVCICFVDHCMSFCPFSFGHCVVCHSSIYGFWFPVGIFNLFLFQKRTLCSKLDIYVFTVIIISQNLFPAILVARTIATSLLTGTAITKILFYYSIQLVPN
jgi:hypothetical protein